MTVRALVRTSLRKIIMECQARLTETLVTAGESNVTVTMKLVRVNKCEDPEVQLLLFAFVFILTTTGIYQINSRAGNM